MSQSGTYTDTVSRLLADHEDTQAAAPHPRQLSVLVVDDEAALAATLESLLSAHGYRVVGARSGFMAQEALAEEYFPIVIINRGLEGGDGLRVCAEIRERNERGYVFIIMLNARDAVEDVVASLEAGADDYLSMQSNEAELIARLNTASRIVRLERALREALAERARPATGASVSQARAVLMKRIARDLERALAGQRAMSVLAFDIDLFKAVNDEHGHVAGDELLRQLENRVRFALPRDQDWLARSSGEEFFAVLPVTDIDAAIVAAEKLRDTVAATPFHVAGADVFVTISLGVGSLTTLGEDEVVGAQALVDQADQYLYRSKLAGRNRVSAPENARREQNGARNGAKR